MSESITVNAAEIARLAGVGRAAVSNWRRRHADFPGPAGGTDSSPLFDLIKVESWLRGQGKLDAVAQRDWLWPYYEVLGDRDRMGLAIAAAGAAGVTAAGGALLAHAIPAADPRDEQLVARTRAVAEAEGGEETFEFLRGRWLDTYVRQISSTPPELAAVMLELVRPPLGSLGSGPGVDRPAVYFDPACGTGTLLATALADPASVVPPTVLGQDVDVTQAALAAVRLAFVRASRTPTAEAPVVQAGDSLRADAYPGLAADAVLCNPPFNERDWGYEELGWDARWQYGTPPRTEPELAWVQHALARLRPGGTAVLLMPPAVAARRAGRRIRSGLLQRGALRAVIALPAGAAPPHGVALHLWVLRAPDPGAGPVDSLLLVDAAAGARQSGEGAGRAALDWGAVQRTAVGAWQAFHEQGAALAERPGVCRAVRIVDLLDDEVDLTPARHVPSAAGTAGGDGLTAGWKQLEDSVREVMGLSAELALLNGLGAGGAGADGQVASRPLSTVGELLRGGHLTLRSGRTAPWPARDGESPEGAVLVLTAAELLANARPAGWIPAGELDGDGPWPVAVPGDVTVVAGPARAVARVSEAPAVLAGPQVLVLSPDPERLDPWFLAGCLRSPANGRQAGTHASTTSRLDVRRMQVPMLPLAEQRRYGAAFRQVDALERALAEVSGTGGSLVQSLYDALATGALGPE
ncbi:N-6 DNA methylase [Kitasatospora herbaricolor]|uniref:N-6 DNA methylase n=1 Tax=Kitasatospora herbaricolor TaxID=68217 RepID=A0ABZ1WFH9_9ACTN|nr:N-6 DNA methylase [Kitasatospora herbaricolor]